MADMADELKIIFNRLDDESYLKLVKLLRLMEEMQMLPKILVVARRENV